MAVRGNTMELPPWGEDRLRAFQANPTFLPAMRRYGVGHGLPDDRLWLRVREVLIRMAMLAQVVDDTMTVWRAELRPIDLWPTGVGIHWAWDETRAMVHDPDRAYRRYSRAKLRRVVFEAVVAFETIDWSATMAMNLLIVTEREIRLREGMGVTIRRITPPVAPTPYRAATAAG